jgi:hypothetical protein
MSQDPLFPLIIVNSSLFCFVICAVSLQLCPYSMLLPTYTHTYTYTCTIHTYMIHYHRHTFTYIHADTYVPMYYRETQPLTCTHKHTGTHPCMYTCTHLYTCTHKYMHPFVHAYTLTHRKPGRSSANRKQFNPCSISKRA